jgi:hypothetical protein
MSVWVEAWRLIARHWHAVLVWTFHHDQQRQVLQENVRARRVQTFSEIADVAIKLKAAGYAGQADAIVNCLTHSFELGPHEE